VRDLSPGRHTIRLSLAGYADSEDEVTVTPGRPERLDVRLAAAGGTAKLIVTSNPPGATVFVDGRETGLTPATVDLATGPHEVRITLAGHHDETRAVRIAPGSNSLTVDLLAEAATPAPAAAPAPVSAPAPEIPKTIDVDCPGCKGTGIIKQIGCTTCHGDGHVMATSCSKCGGALRIDFPCPYCQGRGVLTAGGRSAECRFGDGKGYLPCMGCKGTGKIQRPNPEAAGYATESCPTCTGSGYVEQEVQCRKCGGRGVMVSAVGSQYWSPGTGGVRTTRTFSCPWCGGDGKGPPLCGACHGKGYVGGDRQPRPCPRCLATGREFVRCPSCGGRGWVRARGL
jgi:hypothetical protein